MWFSKGVNLYVVYCLVPTSGISLLLLFVQAVGDIKKKSEFKITAI